MAGNSSADSVSRVSLRQQYAITNRFGLQTPVANELTRRHDNGAIAAVYGKDFCWPWPLDWLVVASHAR
jgi:hypothetical protein